MVILSIDLGHGETHNLAKKENILTLLRLMKAERIILIGGGPVRELVSRTDENNIRIGHP